MSYPLEYLIVLILLFTVGDLGYYFLRERRMNKTLKINQAILDTLSKNLYIQIINMLGKDDGEVMINLACRNTLKSLEKEYGIVLEHLSISKKGEGLDK